MYHEISKQVNYKSDASKNDVFGFPVDFADSADFADSRPAASHSRRAAPLGKYTDFAVKPAKTQKTPVSRSSDEKRDAAIRTRYRLQEASKKLLNGTKPGKRLRACMAVTMPGCSHLPADVPPDVVIVDRDSESGRARYRNLIQCENPWACPICSVRLTEHDKHEVNRAYLAARARGWIAVMVTLTQQHDRHSELAGLMDVNAAARRLYKSNSRFNGDTYGTIKRQYGMVGGITNLETTHGDNAWHPHNHELVFIDPAAWQGEGAAGDSDFLAEMSDTLARRWQWSVRESGGNCDLEHGFHIRTGDDAISEYIAKFGYEPAGGWSVESEMTKGAAKIARQGGRTPFQLLYDYATDDDKASGALFVEYALIFSGRAHIRWSKGLKALLGVDTPEALEVPESTENAPVAVFEPFIAVPAEECWRAVILPVPGRRADFLIAAGAGLPVVMALLAGWNYHGDVYELRLSHTFRPDAPVSHIRNDDPAQTLRNSTRPAACHSLPVCGPPPAQLPLIGGSRYVHD